MIIAYWNRKLSVSSFSIDDIINIIIKFGEPYEEFDSSLVAASLKSSKTTLEKLDYRGPTASGFGLFTATAGDKYHWKIKILEWSSINIGIIEADFAKDNLNRGWWDELYGFSYHQDGNIYTSPKAFGANWNGSRNYGDSFGALDIIHIHLDLRDNYEISWGKNNKKYDTGFDLKKKTNYKLALGFYKGKIELESFQIVE